MDQHWASQAYAGASHGLEKGEHSPWLRQRPVDLNPSLGSQGFLYSHLCGYLGTRQTDSLDNVVDGDVEQPVIKGLHLHSAAGKGLRVGEVRVRERSTGRRCSHSI